MESTLKIETPEILLAKSEGVMDCVKHLIKDIKAEQKNLKEEQERRNRLGYYAGSGEYRDPERKAKIDILTEQKISLEKYAKKLKHMAREAAEK